VNMLKIADYKPEIIKHCLAEVVKLAVERKITPVVGGRFTQEEFTKAHTQLEAGTTIGKLTVFWNE